MKPSEKTVEKASKKRGKRYDFPPRYDKFYDKKSVVFVLFFAGKPYENLCKTNSFFHGEKRRFLARMYPIIA